MLLVRFVSRAAMSWDFRFVVAGIGLGQDRVVWDRGIN